MSVSSNNSGNQNRPIVQVRVEELPKTSAGKFVCRMDKSIMEEIGVFNGDLVEITGKNVTSAIVLPLSDSISSDKYPIIQLDSFTRRNAGVAVGEYVQVRRAEYREAIKVVLSLTNKDEKLIEKPKIIQNSLLDKPVVEGDIINVYGNNIAQKKQATPFEDLENILPMFKSPYSFLREVRFLVVETQPKGIVVITKNTRLEIKEGYVQINNADQVVTYDDIGGHIEVIQKIREMVELPLKHPELFQRLNIDPPKGVLLHGPPGTGKTLLARAVSHEANAYFITINGPEVMSKFYGQSEERLRNIFKEAEEKAPSIIFIDEIDSIAPKRGETMGEVERRVVAQLLAVMDGLNSRGSVIVIGATNRINSIDEALRRPGRFDREIELQIPDQKGRLEILQIHTRGMPLAENVNLEEYARITHGFVGADLMAICREAAMSSLRTILPKINMDEAIPPEILQELVIRDEDFKNALMVVEPSAMREISIEIPNVKWEDVGGLEDVKQELKEAVEWPLKYPDLIKKAGIRNMNGILLYGPPGCGKTLLAKAVANEAEINFISVKGPEIFSKFVGESERTIRELFRKARQSAPAILYFDELDAIVPNRGRAEYSGSNVYSQVVNQILVEMDGIEDRKGVVVMGSTNRPDIIDPALLRPGRFDRLVYCKAPDLDSRIRILKVHTAKMPLTNEIKENFSKLAGLLEGYSGADIENICREAGLQAIRRKMQAFDVVEMQDFEFAIQKIRPSLTKDIIKKYDEIAENMSKARVVSDTSLYS
jgi:transitional endoplasmic reticulum ATPase